MKLVVEGPQQRKLPSPTSNQRNRRRADTEVSIVREQYLIGLRATQHVHAIRTAAEALTAQDMCPT